MIARLAEDNDPPTDPEPARQRAWIATQPGFCGGYHLLDPQTGHMLSLTMWETHDALAAAERAQGAEEGPGHARPGRQSPPTIRIVQVAAVF